MEDELKTLRKEIDAIDHDLFELLKKRFDVAQKIGEIKQGKGIEDTKREAELYALYEAWAKELHLDVDFVTHVFEIIIQESKRIQKHI